MGERGRLGGERMQKNTANRLHRTYVWDILIGMGSQPATAEEVLGTLTQVRDVCGRLDPSVLGDHEVSGVFDAVVAMQRLVSGAVTRLSARYEESGAWKRNGAKSPEDEVARKTGTSARAARRKLATSKRLAKHPKTDQAVREGKLSDEQADEVSSGADASPEDEERLLASAGTDRLHELRRKADEARAKAEKDREERRRRQRKARCVRRWKDRDGLQNLLLKLPDEDMAEVDAVLQRKVDRAYADARDSGKFETWEQYAADVVRDLLTGRSGGSGGDRRTGQAVRPDKKVIALIELAALNRGRVEPGETCEIAGVGPVSVSAIRALLGDAMLAVVIKDGVDVLHVTHFGRHATAHQRTALEARGPRCERCGSLHRLDIEHHDDWADTYVTQLEELGWACGHCHHLKTRHDLRFVGPPGNKRFVTRDGEPWDPVLDDPVARQAAGPPGSADPPDPPTGPTRPVPPGRTRRHPSRRPSRRRDRATCSPSPTERPGHMRSKPMQPGATAAGASARRDPVEERPGGRTRLRTPGRASVTSAP